MSTFLARWTQPATVWIIVAMDKGGIFKGSSLGALGIGNINCTGTSLFNAVKAALVARGYTGLAAKTSWDGCFASAIQKELGHPMLTVGDVKTLTGATGCTTGYIDLNLGDMNPLVAGAGPVDLPSCSDGSDGTGTMPVPPNPNGPFSTTCFNDCGKLPFLSPDWQNCVGKCGGNIVQSPPPQPNQPACAPGMFYDSNAKSCMLMIDPFNCGSKCTQFSPFTPQWVQCMVNCGAKAIGPKGDQITVPNTTPPVPPGGGTSMASIFGSNWLIIVAALAAGVGYVVYRNEQKKKQRRMGIAPATPNRRRRRRRYH